VTSPQGTAQVAVVTAAGLLAPKRSFGPGGCWQSPACEQWKMAERHRTRELTWEEEYDTDPPSLEWVAVPVLATAAVATMATCGRVPKNLSQPCSRPSCVVWGCVVAVENAERQRATARSMNSARHGDQPAMVA